MSFKILVSVEHSMLRGDRGGRGELESVLPGSKIVHETSSRPFQHSAFLCQCGSGPPDQLVEVFAALAQKLEEEGRSAPLEVAVRCTGFAIGSAAAEFVARADLAQSIRKSLDERRASLEREFEARRGAPWQGPTLEPRKSVLLFERRADATFARAVLGAVGHRLDAVLALLQNGDSP